MNFQNLISEYWSYLLLPFIGAGIGWGTNYLAIKMIFKPHKKFKFLFFSLQGLLPKRRKEIAERLGELVENELVHKSDITSILDSKNLSQEICSISSNVIDILIKEIIASLPMAAAFLNEQLVAGLKQKVADHLLANPELITNLITDKLENNLNFKKIAEEKILDLDLDELEKITFKVASTELKHIEFLGGILGFLIGIAQIGIILAKNYI